MTAPDEEDNPYSYAKIWTGDGWHVLSPEELLEHRVLEAIGGTQDFDSLDELESFLNALPDVQLGES
jgi:hypothetical protein